MNDKFVPANTGAGDPTSPEALEAKANVELAKVLQDQRIAQIMQYTATLHQLLPVTAIENQTQYDQVIDAFDSSKKLIKLVEERRLSFVQFPTKVIKLVNNLFKQLRENVEIAKNHFAALIEAKKQFDAQVYERTHLEGATHDPQVTTSEDGVGTVEFADEQQPPSNVVTSAKGAKTHSRTDVEIEIVDLPAFLKLVAGKNKRYEDLQANINQLIEVKMNVLKKLVKEGNRKSLPGLEIKRVSKTV